MKFKKSNKAEPSRAEQKNEEWHDHFTYWPVETVDAVIWLEVVQRRWNPNLNEVEDGHFSAYLGDWEYRECV